MLKSTALQFHFSSCQGKNLSINQLLERFQVHFEGEEHRRDMHDEWESVNLRDLLRASPEKPRGDVFKAMIQYLTDLQRSLDPELQTDLALRNKIVSSCKDIPSCGYVVVQQTVSIAALVNSLNAAIRNSEVTEKAEKLRP